MSFEHRFGVGVGGSPEDPYIHPWCEGCPEPVYERCSRTDDVIKACEGLYKECSELP